MAIQIPEGYRNLLENKAFAHLATLMADGTPQVTPVWCDYDGTHVLLNSAKGRTKDRNMRKNPKVALSILDPENPYRHIALRGKVVEVTEEGADAHIDKLAKRYLGHDRYPFRGPGEIRVLYRVEIESVSTMG